MNKIDKDKAKDLGMKGMEAISPKAHKAMKFGAELISILKEGGSDIFFSEFMDLAGKHKDLIERGQSLESDLVKNEEKLVSFTLDYDTRILIIKELKKKMIEENTIKGVVDFNAELATLLTLLKKSITAESKMNRQGKSKKAWAIFKKTKIMKEITQETILKSHGDFITDLSKHMETLKEIKRKIDFSSLSKIDMSEVSKELDSLKIENDDISKVKEKIEIENKLIKHVKKEIKNTEKEIRNLIKSFKDENTKKIIEKLKKDLDGQLQS